MCEALVDDKQEVEEVVVNLLEGISHTVQLQMFAFFTKQFHSTVRKTSNFGIVFVCDFTTVL